MNDELRAMLQEASDKTRAKYDQLIASGFLTSENWADYGNGDSCPFCVAIRESLALTFCNQCPLSGGLDEGCHLNEDDENAEAETTFNRMSRVIRLKELAVPSDIISAATARRAWLVKRLAAAGYCEADA